VSTRPWYKWFPGDYLQDTVHLSPEADLLYRRLLDIHWRDGSIPSNPEKLRRLSRLPADWFARAWPEVQEYFYNPGGRNTRLFNKRMKSYLDSTSRLIKQKTDAAKTRWNKELHAHALHVQCDPDPDPDPDPDLREEKIPPNSSPPSKSRPVERARFQRPDVRDVTAYCRERRNHVDAMAFVDYYESKGWVVGKAPMKDWRAAVRTWERKDASGKQKSIQSERLPDDYYNPDGTTNAKYADRKRRPGIGTNRQPVQTTSGHDAERTNQGSSMVDEDARETVAAIRLAANGTGDG